jgi:hypothetical protein
MFAPEAPFVRLWQEDMAAQLQSEFVTSLLAEFPDLRDDLEQCDGVLLQQMEAFAQYTQAAKRDGDLEKYERCLQFADRQYAGADATLSAAFRMSYLEHLEFEGSRGPAAWKLVPQRLQSVWNQIAAENRRLQSLPQKHGGQRPHERDFAPRQPHSEGGGKPQDRERGRKRNPRRGRRR